MSATIYYLRPFQPENLEQPLPALDEDVSDIPAASVSPKRAAGRSMPCGRNSKWKKKIGGGVVRREAAPDEPEFQPDE
jgi:hypothetical protein